MTYTKRTLVSGVKKGEYASFYMAGHVRPENTLNRAARLGVTVKTVEHCVFDNSGRGRGGHEGLFKRSEASGTFSRIEAWREGGKVKA